MVKTVVASAYQFKRLDRPHGMIHVLNEGAYVMAEYSELTGIVKWQRQLLATQRDNLEKMLKERFPVKSAA